MTQKELIRWNWLEVIFMKFMCRWLLCTSKIIMICVRSKSMILTFKIGQPNVDGPLGIIAILAILAISATLAVLAFFNFSAFYLAFNHFS